MTSAAITSCNACGSSELLTLVDVADIPIYTNVPQASGAAARAVSKGRISLAFCKTCSHLSNQVFDPKLIEYAPGYEAALDFSPRFRQYADELAKSLIDSYDIRGKRIIEVACGRGDFLRQMCRLGGNQGLGFDPSFVEDEFHDDASVQFVRDYYSSRYQYHRADFLVCRHALEHIPNPLEFLQDLRNALANSDKPLVFLEVPNGLYTLKDLGIWDLIYEHCSYFTIESLSRLFHRAGFDILEANESFEGQFLGIVAQPRADSEKTSALESAFPDVAQYACAFQDNFTAKLAEWSALLARLTEQGKKTVVWGAGSKGVTFLNVLKSHYRVNCVVDINPRKNSLFVPGTGQQIVQPQALKDCKPDVVIVMNPIYIEEIRLNLAKMQLYPEIVAA